jgi:hypothetical protein
MKMKLKQIAYVAVAVVLSLGLVSCERTKISDITADPGSFSGKNVNIAGEVTQSVGAAIGSFGAGAYEIDDGTGKLWVFSQNRGVPTKGAHIGVKGKVSQSVTILGRNFATILTESDRRLEKASR